MQRRFSVVGCGFGELHARYLLALGGWNLDTIYYVRNEAKAHALSHTLGGRQARRLDNPCVLSDCDSELVVVSSYPSDRLPLLAHLDVPERILIVDKPFCGDESGLEGFLATCKSKVRAFFQWRHHPAVVALKESLMDRENLNISISFMHDFLARTNPAFLWRHKRAAATGGAIADLGIHCIDLARFILGPLSLVGSNLRIDQPIRHSIGASIPAETDDSGVIDLAARHCGRASLQFSRVASERRLRVAVTGSSIEPVDIDPDVWWADPSSLKASDWRLDYYRELLTSATNDTVPPREEILNCQLIYLQVLQFAEHKRG